MFPSPPTTLTFLDRPELKLSAGRPEDARALVEAIEASLPELRRYMLWAYGDNGVEFQFGRLVTAQAAYLEGKDFVFHLWQGDEIVGGFGLHRRALNQRALEVGYWIRTGETGRGLASFGVQRLAVFTFHHLGYDRLQCLVNSANLGSLRVAEKLGFRKEAELKYWEAQGEPKHREQGFQSAKTSVMHGLTRDDLPQIDWYQQAVANTKFSDCLP